jgi:hypothetical protein
MNGTTEFVSFKLVAGMKKKLSLLRIMTVWVVTAALTEADEVTACCRLAAGRAVR